MAITHKTVGTSLSQAEFEAADAHEGGVVPSGTPTDGQAAIWTDASTIEGTAIGPVVYVAGDGATTAQKAMALASGGAVCDLTDDETQIQTAINLADDINGIVELLGPNFNIQSTSLTVTCLLRGQGADLYYPATKLTISDGVQVICQNGGNTQDIYLYTTARAVTTELLILQATASTQHYTGKTKLLDGLYVYLDGVQAGTGIKIIGSTKAISRNHFGALTIVGFTTNLHLYAEEPSGSGYVNGNTFECVTSNDAEVHIKLEAAANAEVSGNHFLSVQLQYNATTNDGILTSGAVENNYFRVFGWDWASSKDVIHFAASSASNIAEGRFRYFTDAGSTSEPNIIRPYSTKRKTFHLMAKDGWPSITSPCAAAVQWELPTNDVNVWTLDFDPTTKEYAEWTVILDQEVNYIGDVTAHFLWTPTAVATGGVRWGIQLRTYKDSDALDLAFGAATEVTDTRISTNDVHVSDETAKVAVQSDLGPTKMLQIKVYRDPAHADDGYTGDARLLGVALHLNQGET